MQTQRTVHNVTPLPLHAAHDSLADIEAELARLEAEEREQPGAGNGKSHWRDEVPQHFVASQRAHTTVLCGGLTMAQDRLIEAALTGLGYHIKHLDVPDNDALRFGKEFGNRGQCNPTYFTVGNLVKHLTWLRDEQNIPAQEIVDKYLFVTGGACGPCRFGMYVTEYRKALRDAGFDGFRVLLFQLQGGLKQATGDKPGLDFSPRFFIKLIQAVMIGDVLNLIGYRLRPYEITPGATDAALERCQALLDAAFRNRRGLVPVLLKCRRELSKVAIDRASVKPKVTIIGEFWAMTTEGDGNYRLQRFLEQEGAEVDVQPVTNWLLYMIWWASHAERERLRAGATDPNAARRLLFRLKIADKISRAIFNAYARLLGLARYQLGDMKAIAEAAREHYNLEVGGGEGHMEVGKFILKARQRKATLVVSVKPFGCMPSSGVSDGVQSYVVERHPQTLFLPIETSGDGAVNVYSRVQMMLFKARAAAQREVAQAEADTGLTIAQAQTLARRLPWLTRTLYAPPHSYRASTTAANFLYAVARLRRRLPWLAAPAQTAAGPSS